MSEKQEYIAFVEKRTDVPLFYMPFWLDAVCEDNLWDVVLSKESDGQINGIFLFTIKKRWGLLTSINMPQLTPYLGVLFFLNENIQKLHSLYSKQKKILENLEAKIPKNTYLHLHLHPSIKNTLSFNWKGFRNKNRYTYVLDLEKDMSDIVNGYKGSLRTDIKKAKSALKIVELKDPKTFYQINSKSFERQSVTVPYTLATIEKIFDACVSKEKLLCLSAEDTEGNIHASVLIVYDDSTAYCIATGADPKYRNSGAISLLLSHAIKISKSKVSKFDFEGGNMPNTEKLFRAFGGEMISYLSIYKSPNRLLDSIFTLMGKF